MDLSLHFSNGQLHVDQWVGMDDEVIIKELVIEQLDHKNLNLDVPFLAGKLASTENLAIEIWKIIDEPIQKAGGQLCKIKLVETENNYVEYFGGKEPY